MRNHSSLITMLLLVVPFLGCDDQVAIQKDLVNQQPLPEADSLVQELDEVLDFTFDRPLSLQVHAAWQIVHGAVPFKRSFLVEDDGKKVSAIDYALSGGSMKGWEFVPGDKFDGRRGLRSVLDLGSKAGQGHPDQWFGYLSGCGLAPDEQIIADGATYTLEDLIRQVEWDVPRNATREYSWTVMGLSAYRPSNYEWTASDGQRWSLSQLVEIECGHDLHGSACGGSHRLTALTLALNRHLDQDGKLEGAWKLADEKIQHAVLQAKTFQNADGSFSINYFKRPGTSPDVGQSLGTTGHTLEFLILALDDEQVREPWVTRAVVYLCEAFRRTKDVSMECGALYHSASGLLLYRERLYGPRTFPGV